MIEPCGCKAFRLWYVDWKIKARVCSCGHVRSDHRTGPCRGKIERI